MEDQLTSDTFDLIEKGGVMMTFLLMLSVYALAVVLYKVYQYRKLGVFRKDPTDQVIEELKSGRMDRANQLLKSANTPVSRVVESILKCMYDPALTPEKSEAEVERIGNREIRHLESYLKGLEMTANIGPLMGLLGTVSGMIHAFAQLEAGGAQIDPAILAGGIWEALLTTVAGLAVAIPALAAFYAIDATVERVRAAMKDASIRVLALEDYMHYEEQTGNVHPYPAPQQQETQYAQQQYSQEASGSPFYARASFGG